MHGCSISWRSTDEDPVVLATFPPKRTMSPGLEIAIIPTLNRRYLKGMRH